MKVERFFHIRRGDSTCGGATVRVTGDTTHPTQVEIQAAFCSPKDSYCKKTGRELAAQRTAKIVPLRYLPQELGKIAKRADAIAHGKSIAQFQDYTYAVRYFLPKELA